MKKLSLALVCVLLPFVALSAQTLILTGAPPPSIAHVRNGKMWVSGTITLSYAATTNTSTTTAISPASGSTGRDVWTRVGAGTPTTYSITNTQIYKTKSTSGSIVKSWGEETTSSSNVYQFTFTTTAQTTTFTYWVYYKYNSAMNTGTFELPIIVRSWKKKFSSGTYPGPPDATLPITLSIVVNPSAEISIVGPSDPFDALQFNRTLSFPDLLSTTPAGFRVYVSSNYRYALSVKSTNGGVLKHSLYADETLSYTLSVGGIPITLPVNTYVLIAPNEIYNMASTPKLYQSLVTPAVPDNLAAGYYSDYLTFSITTP